MSAITYVTFNKDEIRNAELSIRDNNDVEFEPTHATSCVIDEIGDILIPSAEIQVDGNNVIMVVDERVTGNVGVYYIIWSIYLDNLKYMHKTQLNIVDL